MTADDPAVKRLCRWCGEPMVSRPAERPSAYARRAHCSRACQVATQNRTRARDKR